MTDIFLHNSGQQTKVHSSGQNFPIPYVTQLWVFSGIVNCRNPTESDLSNSNLGHFYMVLKKKKTFRNVIKSVWTGMQLLSESRDSFIWLQIYFRPNCVQAEITRGKNYYGLKLDICFTESIHSPSTHHPILSAVAVTAERTVNAIKTLNILFSYPTFPTSPTAQWLKMEL